MRVKALTHDAKARHATVGLEDLAEQLGLGFLVPMNEANRLARALGQTRCACVPVFDLLAVLLTHFEARVSRVVLDGHGELGISATLHISRGEDEAAFSCHPADALALAKRAGVPVYATDEAIRHACPLDEPHSHETAPPDVLQWLERVRPEDFEG
jgi:bifunctional DNase/RNase